MNKLRDVDFAPAEMGFLQSNISQQPEIHLNCHRHFSPQRYLHIQRKLSRASCWLCLNEFVWQLHTFRISRTYPPRWSCMVNFWMNWHEMKQVVRSFSFVRYQEILRACFNIWRTYLTNRILFTSGGKRTGPMPPCWTEFIFFKVLYESCGLDTCIRTNKWREENGPK